jgi:8-oxo-dGTP pyrophosphatase MutT (NUDIX family)
MSFLRRIISQILLRFWQFQRGMTLGVRAIVIDDEGRVCLVRHTYVPGWYLPGGGVEVGETMLASLKRELEEEANIEVTEDPELLGMYLNYKHSKRDHVGLYITRKWQQSAPHKPDMEIAECRFFALDKLPKTTTDGTRARLAEALQDGEKSLFWS